jgi:tRNA modification GTPase
VSAADQRNLAALLTPPGVGAIAVVRLAGPGVVPFLQSCFSRPVQLDKCVHGELRDGENMIDDPVIVLSADGHVADINLHGGAWVVKACTQLAKRHGFEIVDARAPLPAFTVDADDELEAEILSHLPLAGTEAALAALLAQRQAWREINIVQLTVEQLDGILADRSLYWMLHPPRVAIVGVPNAGKSTLANQLFGTHRSITADMPGTTRDWVGEKADIDGLLITLLDTPGIRTTDDALEATAIGRAGEQIRSADAIVLVLDATRLNDPEQNSLLDRFPKAIRVLNKADVACVPSTSRGGIPTVGTTGDGVDAVRGAIRSVFDCEPIDQYRPRWWTEAQRQRLVQARSR